jgi:ATP-dependent DNA helicase RecG
MPKTVAPITSASNQVLQKALQKLGLLRPEDLALHLPLRYEDETRVTHLADAQDGAVVQIEGVVTACEVAYRPRRQLLVTLQDGDETCLLRFFSFYPSQQKALAVGQHVRARGEIKGGFMGWAMMHPQCRSAAQPLPQWLTPIYSTVAGLSQPRLRSAVHNGLAQADLAPTIPDELAPSPLWSLNDALSFLHKPGADVPLSELENRNHPAWQRLKAEELLAQQLSQLQARRARAQVMAPAMLGPTTEGLRQKSVGRGGAPSAGLPLAGLELQAASLQNQSLQEKLRQALPFKLTAAQERVAGELAADLSRRVPMHRLLQGDVGSGKTVVAALAACVCIDAGWQCALMAPTEILAQQHFQKLVGWLEPLGVQVAWLTGSQKKKERHAMLALIASGQAALVVGTHAVITKQVQFKNLALAIIDEQHRFGVAQRLALRSKASEPHSEPQSEARNEAHVEPHLLMMTATPIPRTLAMSYYADLDVSTLDELPPGRSPVLTKLLSQARRDEIIERIRLQVAQGRQVYWVCPLIEESEALDLVNATQTHAELQHSLQGRSPTVQVGLLHSRMATEDKKAVMAAFTRGDLAVLVSTTVIEVGVDVPNASLMVIEHAERFGLSQLHQLRGRVGRGSAASACLLLYATGDAPRLGEGARERLRAMVETSDGFEIARRDLEIRGPGEFLGSRQSGAALLRFADLAQDVPLLAWAREVAPTLLDQHPALASQHVARWLGGRTDFLKA